MAAEDEMTDFSNVVAPAPQLTVASKPPTPSSASATSFLSPTPESPLPLTQTSSSPSPALEISEVSPPSNHANDVHQPGAAQLVEVPDVPDLVLGGLDPSHLASVDNVIQTFINEPLLVTPAHAHPQENARLDSPPENRTAQNVNCGIPTDPLPDVSNAPGWMRKKRTLDYFRNIPKLGCLSDVIQRWYELEGLLGFPEIVSFHEYLVSSYCMLMISRHHQDSQYLNVHQ